MYSLSPHFLVNTDGNPAGRCLKLQFMKLLQQHEKIAETRHITVRTKACKIATLIKTGLFLVLQDKNRMHLQRNMGIIPYQSGKAGLTGIHPWWQGGTLGGACGRRLPRAEETLNVHITCISYKMIHRFSNADNHDIEKWGTLRR